MDRYDIPTPTRFLAYIECSKIPAPMSFALIKKPNVYNSFKLTNFDDIQTAGKQTLKNLQILGLRPLSYIPNFLGVPVLKSQNRKFAWLIRKSQISKFQKNATQLCLKAVR